MNPKLRKLLNQINAKKIEVQDLVDQYATYPGRTSVLPYSITAASVIYDQRIFADLGVEAVSSTPAEFSAVIRAETAQYAKLIKEAGIKAT